MKSRAPVWMPTGSLLVLAVLSPCSLAVDEDSGTLYELGILNWVQYQQLRLSKHVYENEISDAAFATDLLDVTLANSNVHGRVIFENNDDTHHRIVFAKHVGNDLRYEIRSPAIAPGERWAIEILRDGFYPFHCSIHAESMQGSLQVRYEDEDYW